MLFKLKFVFYPKKKLILVDTLSRNLLKEKKNKPF